MVRTQRFPATFPPYQPTSDRASIAMPPSYGPRKDLDEPARAHSSSTRAQRALETTNKGAPLPFPDYVGAQPRLVFQTNVEADVEPDLEAGLEVRSASLGLISILIVWDRTLTNIAAARCLHLPLAPFSCSPAWLPPSGFCTQSQFGSKIETSVRTGWGQIMYSWECRLVFCFSTLCCCNVKRRNQNGWPGPCTSPGSSLCWFSC